MTTNIAAGAAAGLRPADDGAGAPVMMQALSRSFGAVRALDGLSLDISPGELVALLGPSGCGKTTALRILAGFEAADSGSVTVDGKDIMPVPAAKRDMGMVFQSYSLFPNMTALNNVAYGLRMRGHVAATGKSGPPRCWRSSACRRGPGSIPIRCPADNSNESPWPARWRSSRASCCLMSRCRPSTLKYVSSFASRSRPYNSGSAITTVFVTHDQEEALSMADRVGVMRSGKLEQIAVPERAVRAAGHRVRRGVRRHNEPDPRRL